MYDVIVIGAGIAGLTAALYSSRQGLKTLVISADLGGQLLLAPEIQNYPGFKSISGFDLAKRVEEQARLYGAEIIYDEVTEVGGEKGRFTVKTVGGVYDSSALILAFGKTPREMDVPGEQRLKGRGVSYCAVCDAALYRGKDVALVGWGYHGAESVLLLANYARKVYWVYPGKSPGVEEEMLSLVRSKGNVEEVAEHVPHEVKGEKRVEAFVVRHKSTGELRELKVDGVFVEMGYVAKTDFVKGFVELNENGEIIVDKLCRTSREGVFAAGDVTDTPFKQAVISAGQGATAALAAYQYVLKLRGKKAKVIGDWKHLKVGKEEEKPKGGFFLKI